MTFKELKNQIKEEQKVLAYQIKIGKPLRKPHIFAEASSKEKSAFNALFQNSNDFRHRHIVYCQMFNNTPYDKIEQPRKGNAPSKYALEKYAKKWELLFEPEALRRCA